MTQTPRIAADLIRELTQPHTTMTIIERDNGTQEIHRINELPLLAQLDDAITGSTNLSDDEATRGGFGSKPAAHLEAIDTLARIDKQARQLAADNGINPTGTLTTILHKLSGAIGDKPHRKVHSWWAAARMVTQHDLPPHKPHGIPCPVCWETNTLRIKLDTELATCTECQEAWDRTGEEGHGSLDILGKYVKWCGDHEVTKPRHWKTTADGYPTECVECLDFRQTWAEWRTRTKTENPQPGRDVA